MNIAWLSFSNWSVFKMSQFFPRKNAKPVFSNSSGLKSVFEKLRFRDGLVWTVGLTVEIKSGIKLASQSQCVVLCLMFNAMMKA